MFFKKIWIIVSLTIVFVFSSGSVEGQKGYAYKHTDVESIYDSIRNAAPEYEWEEQVVTFWNEGMKLVCTLVTPKGVHKPPVVITLNGFAEDRFYKEIPGTGGEHYYPRLSRLLGEHGIATLRVDYRGTGESDGDYTMTTFSTQISDAVAAVKFVRSRLGHTVDANSIGMLGFSQGGLVTAAAASMERHIDSIVLLSAPASPPIAYAGLLSTEGIKQGLALPDGGTIILPIYVGDVYLGDIELGKGFFQDLFNVDPVAAVCSYKGPMMYVAGKKDTIVWPQPNAGQAFINYHDGQEELVVVNGDHEFDSDYGYEIFDDAVFWAAAWFIKTLN